jgi:hypothetical protein
MDLRLIRILSKAGSGFLEVRLRSERLAVLFRGGTLAVKVQVTVMVSIDRFEMTGHSQLDVAENLRCALHGVYFARGATRMGRFRRACATYSAVVD